VTRFLEALLSAGFLLSAAHSPVLFAQQSSSPTAQKQQAKPSPDDAEPPEEDESLLPEKIPFDPMAAERSIKVGDYYFHKGNARAALKRYELASKYNPSSPEAFFKLGEAEDKLKNLDAAKLAFEKVVHLAPNTKLAEEAQKKMKKKG
jgi:tetratricopeptide (TPR) repeat protein